MTQLVAVVLAAGRSRRMRSRLSKVLHPVAGLALVHSPVATALNLGAQQVVVVVNPDNHDAVEKYLLKAFPSASVSLAIQDPPRGTGDAVCAGLQGLSPQVAGRVLILAGDVPLVTAESLQDLVRLDTEITLAVGTCRLSDPTGYGRILRDDEGKASAIVEQKDLQGDAQAAINEINTGLYCADYVELTAALKELQPNNAQGEYYLTDIVPSFAAGGGVRTTEVSEDAILGVNDRKQLGEVEKILRTRIADNHRLAGASIADSAHIDANVTIGQDVTIQSGVHLRGTTSIGDGCTIDVGCVITNCQIADNTIVLPYTVASDSQVGESCRLGPFTHLRPNTILEEQVHLGNFVETKATRMCTGSKANHLAYLGNSEVGSKSNIGAGTIFCNYDGYSKHFTRIGSNVFVGSDSQLIAPITVGDGAFIATATCVTENVPANAVAIGRVHQVNKEGYASKLRARLQAAKLREGQQSEENTSGQ